MYVYTRKHQRQCYNQNLVGLNGLEPSTSRLSGGRSNLLSYKPIFLDVATFFFAESYPRPQVTSNLLRVLSLKTCGVEGFLLWVWFKSLSLGGDNRDRTDDPLLAKQVLSQLSYTPVAFLFQRSTNEPQKLNNEKT